ncbi:DUF58 domain-containing protein [Halomicroarcula sp. GCM10025324]|uniref:DUF58 domain-containing protein n=1 Tax=Haloarcula TaxID=2237 RepID=UPI0023E78E01|nr:DUF58 domain-containing protein [Halomicroarcula sp. ZS-22-S1]
MTTVRATGRWRGIVAVALLAVAAGVLLDRPAVLLLGIVGAGFAAYPRLSGPPTVEVELERRLDDRHPKRGDPVTVTAHLTNVGERTLTDVRIVDGVPPMLTVASGSPRHAAVLRPGQSTTFTYALDADHGHHTFDPATVIARDITGAHEIETTVSAEGELHCSETVPEVPLRRQTDNFAGQLTTDGGGSGTEFHTIREYNRGDSIRRIDSKRWAKTGELTTIEFREERRSSVLLLLDAREKAYRSASDEDPNAVAHSIAAAEQLLTALDGAQNQVGLAAFGREFCWEGPGGGADHLTRLRQLLSSHPTLSSTPSKPGEDGDLERQRERLYAQLGTSTQVVVLSPLTDEWILQTIRRLEAGGHATTVISPDVTAAETLGQRMAQLERQNRLHALRQTDIPVVDWDPATALGTVLLNEGRRRRSA